MADAATRQAQPDLLNWIKQSLTDLQTIRLLRFVTDLWIPPDDR